MVLLSEKERSPPLESRREGGSSLKYQSLEVSLKILSESRFPSKYRDVNEEVDKVSVREE